MTTEAQLRDEIHQARTAKRLRNDFLGDFFKERDARIFQYIKDLPLGSKQELVEAHHQLKSLDALRQDLDTVINTGKLAEKEAEGLDPATD